MLDLSIIIVNFNTKDLTKGTVESIFDSKPKVSFEIIIVDNGSTDGSREEFTKFINKKIKFVLNNENLGYSRANNIGIKIANGKYILLLNSDTKVLKESLDALVEFSGRQKDAGVVGPRLKNMDDSIQASVMNFPKIRNAIAQFWFGKRNKFSLYAPDTYEPTAVDAVVGAAFLISPKARESVGLLDERYFMYFEDLDYCGRVWKKGLKVYYLPSAEIIHYHGASGKHLAGEKNQWRRLVPSSKIYHGVLKHYIINFIIWSGQKLKGF